MIIGLTGRTCAGKDSVARLLDKSRFTVIDEDGLGHQALAASKESLREAFGDCVIASDGSVDRRVLGPMVFADAEKLGMLNAITHPWMKRETMRLCREAEEEGRIAVINAALLESMGFVPACDAVILVTADPRTRERRALSRDGMTPERFRDRDRSQEDIGRTLAASGVRTFEIANDGDEDTLSRQVNILCAKLLEEALLWERRQG